MKPWNRWISFHEKKLHSPECIVYYSQRTTVCASDKIIFDTQTSQFLLFIISSFLLRLCMSENRISHTDVSCSCVCRHAVAVVKWMCASQQYARITLLCALFGWQNRLCFSTLFLNFITAATFYRDCTSLERSWPK